MGVRDVLLNPAQLEVLAWVRDGCANGVYDDWSHRITARALHNRGLVVVKGHGPTWSAEITNDGVRYLDTGTYPPADSGPRHQQGESGTGMSDRQASADEAPPVQRPSRPTANRKRTSSPKPKQPGPMDQMMTALQEADRHRIYVPRSEENRYRQLVSVAKRFRRIPDGMQITIGAHEKDQCSVTLEPLPAWQTRILKPLPVPSRLHNPSDVTTALAESETFQVTGRPRKRALRMVEALTSAAREQGMTVRALLNRPVTPGYAYRDSPRRDEMEFSIESDEFRLWFTQATLQEPHEATQREITRVQHGYLFPDYDDVPATHLGLVLNGEGGKFWAGSWHDSDEHELEQDLPQMLEEIRLRHERLVEKREADHERALAQQARDQEDRAIAAEKYRGQFVIDAMSKQAKQWEEAARLRRYAAAIRETAKQHTGEEQTEARSWAERIESRADTVDPLPGSAKAPDVPDPSYSDLSAFMKSGSSRRY